MKTITLIRHGRVDLDDNYPMHAKELPSWIQQYDKAHIDTDSRPTQELIDSLVDADIVLISSLSRAAESASILGLKPNEKNHIFDELPIPIIGIPLLKLKPMNWFTLVRILMLLRIKVSGISWQVAKDRGEIAADCLNTLSQKHDKVVLVGHGGMNWLTHHALKKKGWELSGRFPHENWSSTTLTKAKNKS